MANHTSQVTRNHWITLNRGCLLIYSSVYIEKGMGLIIPGLAPDALVENDECRPSMTEIAVAAGIFACGALLITLMLKVALSVMRGEATIWNGEEIHAFGNPDRPESDHA